ncbi:MAG TPA: efflux RND transporter periplasmic adaptor subunit [bacterium]|nr:MAG: Multidrug resistance protein MdtA precursor [bacterium ADurb.Bin478]HOC89055.1 efflux RND transporter periplasmic adaptor subunit [bacterium]
MKSTSVVKRGLILVSAYSALALMGGCGKAEKQASAKPANSGAEVVPVETARVERQALAVTKSYTGSLEGEAQANIVAKISERITAVYGSVGQSVQKGRTVITLDKSGATSQYFQAEANYKNAGKNLERMKALLAEGAISQQLFDATQTAFDVAKANFEAARSAVELVSPISGVITALNVNLGDLSQPGAVLATVADIRRMKVIFSVNEADVMQLAPGQSVEIWSEGGPKAPVQGKIVQISRSADVRSRSFEIKALFSNTADQRYRPGMFCKVALTISPRSNALVVPAGAILSDGLTTKVYKVVGGRAIPQPVLTGISDGSRVEILQGLQDQEMVVTTGATNLRDSSLVSIAPAAN